MTDPIQEQLIIARRNQILDAASSVFSQKGFHRTTIKDIAREAGIADGTIYNYFKNKPTLLIGIFDRMREMLEPDEDAMQQLTQLDFRTFIKSFLQLPLNTLNDNDFELFRVIISEMMINEDVRKLYYEQIFTPTVAIAEAYLIHWTQQRNIKTLDIQLTIHSVSSLMMGLMIQNIMGDEVLKSRWEELPDFVTNLLIDGLGHHLK